MATLTICDECGVELGRVKITVTDHYTGDEEEVCSTKCMKDAVDRQDRAAAKAKAAGG